MVGKVLNIKVGNPLKLSSGLTGNYHAICHYSYILSLTAKKNKLMRIIATKGIILMIWQIKNS